MHNSKTFSIPCQPPTDTLKSGLYLLSFHLSHDLVSRPGAGGAGSARGDSSASSGWKPVGPFGVPYISEYIKSIVRTKPSQLRLLVLFIFLKFLFYLICVCDCFIFLGTACLLGDYRGQKRVSDHPELKLQITVSQDVGSGN